MDGWNPKNQTSDSSVQALDSLVQHGLQLGPLQFPGFRAHGILPPENISQILS